MLHILLAVESVDRQVLHFSVKRLLMSLPLSEQLVCHFERLVSRFMIPFFKVILRNNPSNDPNKRRKRGNPRRKTDSRRTSAPTYTSAI